MGRKNIIAGLEIGRTKVSMVALEARNGEFNLLGASKINCSDGTKNGAVVDLDSTSEAVIKLVDEISQKSRKKINYAFVNISGLNIEEEITTGVTTLSRRGSEISERNIRDLLESCKIVYVPLDRYLLYLFPLEYIIDGQGGIKNPIGLCGSKLEAKVMIVTAPFNQVQNIAKAVNFAGMEVGEVVLGTLANSCSILSGREKKDGVLLIDFKASLTEVSIFKDNSLLFFKTIPKGQEGISSEIAARLNMPFEFAEELKIRYGFLDVSEGPDSRNQDSIPLEWMGKNQNISRGELNKIISGQFQQIIDLILDNIKGFGGFNNIVKSGAVVTGGCTAMEGFSEWTSAKFGLPVKRGLIESNLGLSSEDYATAFGLAKLGFQKNQEAGIRPEAGIFKKVIQKTGEILSDYF